MKIFQGKIVTRSFLCLAMAGAIVFFIPGEKKPVNDSVLSETPPAIPTGNTGGAWDPLSPATEIKTAKAVKDSS